MTKSRSDHSNRLAFRADEQMIKDLTAAHAAFQSAIPEGLDVHFTLSNTLKALLAFALVNHPIVQGKTNA